MFLGVCCVGLVGCSSGGGGSDSVAVTPPPIVVPPPPPPPKCELEDAPSDLLASDSDCRPCEIEGLSDLYHGSSRCIEPLQASTISHSSIEWVGTQALGVLSRPIEISSPNAVGDTRTLDIELQTDANAWLSVTPNSLQLQGGESGIVSVQGRCKSEGEYSGTVTITDQLSEHSVEVTLQCVTDTFERGGYTRDEMITFNDVLPTLQQTLVGTTAYAEIGWEWQEDFYLDHDYLNVNTLVRVTPTIEGDSGAETNPGGVYRRSFLGRVLSYRSKHEHIYGFEERVRSRLGHDYETWGFNEQPHHLVLHTRNPCAIPGRTSVVLQLEVESLVLETGNGELDERWVAEESVNWGSFYVKWDVNCIPLTDNLQLVRVYQGALVYEAAFDNGTMLYDDRRQTGIVVPNKDTVFEVKHYIPTDISDNEITVRVNSNILEYLDDITVEPVNDVLQSYRQAFLIEAEDVAVDTQLEVTFGYRGATLRAQLFGEPDQVRAQVAMPVTIAYVPITLIANSESSEINEITAAQWNAQSEQLRTVLPIADSVGFQVHDRLQIDIGDVDTSDLGDVSRAVSRTYWKLYSYRNQQTGDASGYFYIGVLDWEHMPYSGFASVNGNISLVSSRSFQRLNHVTLHEFGHNLSRPHPHGCEAAGQTYQHPYANGAVGDEVFWYLGPERHHTHPRRIEGTFTESWFEGVAQRGDIMSYCGVKAGFTQFTQSNMAENLNRRAVARLIRMGSTGALPESFFAAKTPILSLTGKGSPSTTSTEAIDIDIIEMPTNALPYLRGGRYTAQLTDQNTHQIIESNPIREVEISHVEQNLWHAFFTVPEDDAELQLRIIDNHLGEVVLHTNVTDGIQRAYAEIEGEGK